MSHMPFGITVEILEVFFLRPVMDCSILPVSLIQVPYNVPAIAQTSSLLAVKSQGLCSYPTLLGPRS